jgi:hypothetical protein
MVALEVGVHPSSCSQTNALIAISTHKFMNSKKITLWQWIIDLEYLAEIINDLRCMFESILGLGLQPCETRD